MPQLTIVADITANADKAEFVKAELQKLIAPSLNDEGCVQYDLHLDNNDPAHFLFYENWTSRELWQQHMKTQHLQDYRAATEGMAEVTIYEMTKVD